MTRKSTVVWIVSAIVVAGAGIGVAAAALPASTSASGATASPTADRPSATSSAGIPSTASGSQTPADPAVTSSSPSAPSPGPSPTTGASPVTSTAPTASAKPSAPATTVTPALTFYQWNPSQATLEVGGNVPGLVDAGGSCIVTAVQGAVRVTQSFAATPQASSTECGTMRVVSSKLTGGTWNLTIGYRSSHASGTSATTTVTL